MKIALFALTGFGNDVLFALNKSGRKPACLVTRKEKASYPYYPVEEISTLAQKLDVPTLFGTAGDNEVLRGNYDVILVATYDRILSLAVINSVKYAVNLHPSLLPQYRGASPCFWVIRNGERQTGVTAHMLTQQVDGGDILWQQAIDIESTETQGSLRKKLSALAAEGGIEVLESIANGTVTARAQAKNSGSEFPRFDETHRELNLSQSEEEVQRHIRALTPWPGAKLNG